MDNCQKIQDEAIEELFEQVRKCNKRSVEYLKIMELYYKRIIQSEDIIDAKMWACQMIDHALQVED